MKIRWLISIVFLLTFVSTSVSQKLHFSNYNYAPLVLSPAQTGGFYGTIRMGGAVREQFRGFLNQPFQTLSVYADSPVSFIVNERQWLGVGLSVFQTSAGDLDLQETSIVPSIAFHRALDDDYNNVIGIGLNYAVNKRRIKNSAAFRSEDQILGTTAVSPDFNLIDNLNISHSGLSVGVYFKKMINDDLSINTGAGILDIYNSGFRYNSGNIVNKAPVRINAYSQWTFVLNSKMIFSPMLVYQRHHKVNNFFGSMEMEHLMDNRRDLRFNYRIGFRVNDAIMFGAGVKYNSWDIGLNYDMTVSSAQAHNGLLGALELGIKKIIVIHPKPKLKFMGLCPRL